MGKKGPSEFFNKFLCFRPCVCVVVHFRVKGGLQQHCVRTKTPESFCNVDEFECTDLSSWFDNMIHFQKLLSMHSKNSGHDIPC
jgi:hypothetical protein